MATRDINIQRRSSGRQINLRVLLDLDQVLADFEGHFLKEFRRKYPNEPYVDLEHREGFFIREQYEQIKPGLGETATSMWTTKGFFQNLEEIPGSVTAAKEMAKMEGVDVCICTSPIVQYKYCLREKELDEIVNKHFGSGDTQTQSTNAKAELQETPRADDVDAEEETDYPPDWEKMKYHWVEKHLGKSWVERIILTRDKTMVAGHILIDDKQHIAGLNPYPTWEHVVFSACHNKNSDLKGKRRLDNWTDGSWRELIEDFKKRI